MLELQLRREQAPGPVGEFDRQGASQDARGQDIVRQMEQPQALSLAAVDPLPQLPVAAAQIQVGGEQVRGAWVGELARDAGSLVRSPTATKSLE
ncbi:hypothetical protein ACGFY3_39530 [Streptomyces mirabilis]|uniref:hypothetical protein n=1 Tax=Streptomyces mirabilis TaxID=68239 RepID=UPI0037139B01